MSYGLAKAGINVLAGIDYDPTCRETYEKNNWPAKFLERDIASLEPADLACELKLEKNDDNLIFVGCTPCQYWSKINTDRRKSSETAFLLREFERFIIWFRPGFIVIENVPGLLSKKRQSILPQFERCLQTLGYAYAQGVVNTNFYGVPQNRHRYLLLASRLDKTIVLPKGRRNKNWIVRKFIGRHKGFPPIAAGTMDRTSKIHSAASLSAVNLLRIKKTPANGGTRESWKNDSDLQIPAYEGKDRIFADVYSRMYWNRPAPTITTRFNSFSNGRFGHPTENRAISLREGASLQTFPRHYIFKAPNQASIARQIGNAVPPALAVRIGRHLKRIHMMLATQNNAIRPEQV